MLAWAGSAAVLVLAFEVGVIVTMLVKNKSEHGTELASALNSLSVHVGGGLPAGLGSAHRRPTVLDVVL
jgi:hypothetical protein